MGRDNWTTRAENGWGSGRRLGARASRPRRFRKAKTDRKPPVFHNRPSSGAAGSRTSGSHAMLVQKVLRHFRGCGILLRHLARDSQGGRNGKTQRTQRGWHKERKGLEREEGGHGVPLVRVFPVPLPVDAPAGRLGSGKHAEGHPHPSSLKENKRAAVCGIANSRPVAAHEIRAAVCNNPGSRHMFGAEGHGPGGGEFHGESLVS